MKASSAQAMLGFLDYRCQEARGLYRQVPEGEELSNGEKQNPSRRGSLESIVQKIYRVAPFLLLLNLVFATIWTAHGLSHILKRPRSFAPDCKI